MKIQKFILLSQTFCTKFKNLSWWDDIEKKFKKYGFQPPQVKTISPILELI